MWWLMCLLHMKIFRIVHHNTDFGRLWNSILSNNRLNNNIKEKRSWSELHTWWPNEIAVFWMGCTRLAPTPYPTVIASRFINHEKIICLTPHYLLQSDRIGVRGARRVVRIIWQIVLTTKCRLTFDYIRIRVSPVRIIRFNTYTFHSKDYFDGY